MRSKFKDEHPFGMWRVLADVRSELIRRPAVQTSARRRLSASGRSILTGYPYVVALSDVCRSLIDGMLRNAVPIFHIIGHLRESGQDGHSHYRQEEVPGAISASIALCFVMAGMLNCPDAGSYSGPVRVRYPEAD